MADTTTTNYADFLREMRGPITVNYSKLAPSLDLIKRDSSKSRFSGNQVRVPLVLSFMPHAGLVREGGTVNEPGPFESTQAHIKLCRLVQPMGITDEAIQDSENTSDTSWKEAEGNNIEQCVSAMARTANMLINGAGDGLIASITSGATSATQTIGTSANFYFLQPGVYVDVRTRSNGNLVTDGARRKIASVDEAAGTVTLDLSITTTTNEGLYLESSYTSAGDLNGWQGLQQALAQTGTFEDVARATYPQWKAVDGRGGDTTSVDLSEPVLDGTVRRTMQKSGEAPDWWLGDPAVLDKYAQSHLALQRFPGESRKLDTGFDGVMYRTQPMYFDFDHKTGSITGIKKSSITVYAQNQGPDWFQFPGGGMYFQFNRSFTYEAWLYDRTQIGYHRLNNLTYANNLNRAS